MKKRLLSLALGTLRNRVRYLTFTAGTMSLRADLKDIIRMFLQMLR